MSELSKKAELLNQNPSLNSVIGIVQEMAVELDKLTPKERVEGVGVVMKSKLKELNSEEIIEENPKRKKK